MAWSPYSLRSQASTPQQTWPDASPVQQDGISMLEDVNARSALSQIFHNPSPRPTTQAAPACSQTWTSPDQLSFLPLAEWSECNSYEELIPTRIHYSVEWRLVLNGKAVFTDTELDSVLDPTAYWHVVLKPKFESLLQRKFGQSQTMKCDDTNLVVSVNHRSRRKLTKTFEGLDIDWSIVAKQLAAWSDLLRDGRKLRVELTFNYTDSSPSTTATSRQKAKLGSSATRRMLAERAAQLDAENEASSGPPVWQQVYALMRCPGPPCALGPHCWRDPNGHKHYKLRTPHLKLLIDFVAEGGVLQSHDDVPVHVREQLFIEEQQRLDRAPKYAGSPTPSYPPINITNVLPSSESPPAGGSIDLAPTNLIAAVSITSLALPVMRDTAVRLYSVWQQTQVADEDLRGEFAKAQDAALKDGLDLEQIFEDRDVCFFVRNGVKRGIARRFVCDIGTWAALYKAENSIH